VRVIGVDLGGTKVAAGSLQGRELSAVVVAPTERSGSAALIEQLVAIVERLRCHQFDGVGIGVPSVVEFETGRVVASVNVPLADLPLRRVLEERLSVPVFVDNDATVAALAEAHNDELSMVSRNLVMLTVGTGVGGGLILGGRIYRGATGGAGELGHTLIGANLADAVPAPVTFPQPGSLERLSAGHALDRLAASAAVNSDSALGQLRAEGKPVRGPDAVRCARAGDPVAARVIELWGERLGIGVANVINTFDPNEVVIGGGAASAGDLLLESARRTALGFVVPGLGRNTRIRLARHGEKAGVLGAALLAEHELQHFRVPRNARRMSGERADEHGVRAAGTAAGAAPTMLGKRESSG
jgi:glucokinase